MVHEFAPGDYLIFQIESGFGLLRVLSVDEFPDDDGVWHVSAFNELFPDIEMAEAALANPSSLTVSHQHLALTNRAFESTQVSKIGNAPLSAADLAGLEEWRSGRGIVSDRSVRLLLGLR